MDDSDRHSGVVIAEAQKWADLLSTAVGGESVPPGFFSAKELCAMMRICSSSLHKRLSSLQPGMVEERAFRVKDSGGVWRRKPYYRIIESKTQAA